MAKRLTGHDVHHGVAHDTGDVSFPESKKPAMERLLDVVERVGNRVPHPAVIFVLLILFVILLSHVVYLLGASVTYQVVKLSTSPVSGLTA